MDFKFCLILSFQVCLTLVSRAGAWTGNICNRLEAFYVQVEYCNSRYFRWCLSSGSYWQANYRQVSFCCPGWTDRGGDQVCMIPVCNPPCQNGGTCRSPGSCTCPSTHQGFRCETSTCSYTKPCFPGMCNGNSNCDCASGFRSPSTLATYMCLEIEDDINNKLATTEMQVRMSYWPRDRNQELYMIMADSTNLAQGKIDEFWSNRRAFNRIEIQCGSMFTLAQIPDAPFYVSKYKFGVSKGVVDVYLLKLAPGGQGSTFVSLNNTIQCFQPVSALNPVDQLYNCSIVDPNFDRLLEHRDALKFTFKTQGGGFRTLVNTDISGSFWMNQTFLPISREQSVQFKFDFRDPTHCEETALGCSRGEAMLRVPDKTRTAAITITWNGWRDEDSGMYRYAWEVFKMTKATEGELEIHPENVLHPLKPPTEVLEAHYTTQHFTLPGPGMYSIILEAGDKANNTKFVRRLCFYDPDPQITSDPQFLFYVTTASPAANYVYQNDTSVPVHVSWEKYFKNALHEDEGLLGSVRRYPVELRDTEQADETKLYKKVIEPTSKQEDHEGERSVSAISNKRGIIKFDVAYDKDSNGGRNKISLPLTWINLGLSTSYTVPYPALYAAETVTIWVRATDYMGSQKVERVQVSFDSTQPNILGTLIFHMNVPVQGIEFSSTFELLASDPESGVAYVLWTFIRAGNQKIVHQIKAPGVNVSEASCQPQDITTCNCVKTGFCFKYNNSLSLSNCLMVKGLDMESQANDAVVVYADITNMAGLVRRVTMKISDVSKLNGTQVYFPPQNITVISRTLDSVTFKWTFPPSCFLRTASYVKINDQNFLVHKDATEYTVAKLQPGTSYTVYMNTIYEGGIESLQEIFTIETNPDPKNGLDLNKIIGFVIAFLLVLVIVTIIVVFGVRRKRANRNDGAHCNPVYFENSSIRK